MKKIILLSLVFVSMVLGQNTVFDKVYKIDLPKQIIDSKGRYSCIHNSKIQNSVNSGPFISFKQTDTNYLFIVENKKTGVKSEISIPKRSFTCIIRITRKK